MLALVLVCEKNSTFLSLKLGLCKLVVLPYGRNGYFPTTHTKFFSSIGFMRGSQFLLYFPASWDPKTSIDQRTVGESKI